MGSLGIPCAPARDWSRRASERVNIAAIVTDPKADRPSLIEATTGQWGGRQAVLTTLTLLARLPESPRDTIPPSKEGVP